MNCDPKYLRQLADSGDYDESCNESLSAAAYEIEQLREDTSLKPTEYAKRLAEITADHVQVSMKLVDANKELKLLRGIVAKLDKTEDGVPITPDMELWQVDKRFGLSGTNGGKPWPCGPGWTFQRISKLPVYSTKAAAELQGASNEV